MNCHEFEKSVLALARNRLLDAATRKQSLIHTESCERCAARMAEEQALLARMRAVVAELAEEEPPARLDAALLAAFRAQTATAASSTVVSRQSRARHLSSWKLAAVAAGILILISVMATLWRSANSQQPRQEIHVVLPTPISSPTSPKPAETPVGSDQVAVKQAENRQRRARPEAVKDGSADAEVVTRFFSLREGEDIAALESLQLVRVELPGSALSEVGLTVDPEMAAEPVKADVVLGQDGLARAIRFVR